MLLGAHMSAAGGVEKAILRGKEVGCDVIQLFTKNNNQWKAKPFTEEGIEAFKKNVSKTGIFPFASHDAYLINLAAPDPEIYRKSMKAFLDEMDRAEILGIPGLVFHPGSHVGSGEEEGIRKIAESLRRLLDKRPGYKVKLLLEVFFKLFLLFHVGKFMLRSCFLERETPNFYKSLYVSWFIGYSIFLFQNIHKQLCSPKSKRQILFFFGLSETQ